MSIESRSLRAGRRLVVSLLALLLIPVFGRLEARPTPAATSDPAQEWAHDQPKIETKQQLFSQDHAADVLAIEQAWEAYKFFVDSGDGKDTASLYTQDAVEQHFWKDKDNKYEPHEGVGSFPTEYGTTRGGPCILHGRKQIAEYFGRPKVMPQPGWGHHTSPNLMVKVSDDGKTAILTTTMLIVGTNDKGDGHFSTGDYRVFFVKSPSEGWLIARQYNFSDRPRENPRCDANGPLPAKAGE